jgi:ferrochelatase
MEVRHDLDVEAAETADALGLAFARAATPGTSLRFASMITELVTERLARPDDLPGPDTTVSDNPEPGGGAVRPALGDTALGDMGVPRQTCPADCCGGSR